MFKGASRTAAKSKMESFVIIVNGSKRSILDVAAVLDPSLPVKHTNFSGNLVLNFFAGQKETIFEILEFHFCFMRESRFLTLNFKRLRKIGHKRVPNLRKIVNSSMKLQK